MPYEVTITRTETVPTTKKGEWVTLARLPWTKKELTEQSRYAQSEEAFLEKNPTMPILGYAPDVETTEVVKTEILKQTVEFLDLTAVIKAINKIE